MRKESKSRRIKCAAQMIECGRVESVWETRQAHPYADTPLATIPAQRRARRLFATDRTAYFSALKD